MHALAHVTPGEIAVVVAAFAAGVGVGIALARRLLLRRSAAPR